MDARTITDEWPTKGEVAKQLGKSVAAVTRLQSAGVLHPKVDDDGCNRYDPEEVKDAVENHNKDRRLVPKDRAEDYAEYQLDTVKQMLELVKGPREKIDELLFGIIDRQEKQIVSLLAKQEADRQKVIAAEDATAERELAKSLILSEQNVKQIAAVKIMETLQKIAMKLSEGKGLNLTPDQLEELVLAGGLLTAEQTAKAKDIIEKAKTTQNPIAAIAQAKPEAKQADTERPPANVT